jgi:hypothetical protein
MEEKKEGVFKNTIGFFKSAIGIYILIVTLLFLLSAFINYNFWKNPLVKKEFYTNDIIKLSNVYSASPINEFKYITKKELSNIIFNNYITNDNFYTDYIYSVYTQLVFIENEYSNYVFNDIDGKISNYNRFGDTLHENIWVWHYKNTNNLFASLYLPNYKFIFGLGARANLLITSNDIKIIPTFGVDMKYRPIHNIDFLLGGSIYSSIDLKLISFGINGNWAY